MSARRPQGSRAESGPSEVTDRAWAPVAVGFVGRLVQGGPWVVRDALALGSRWISGLIGIALSFVGVNSTEDWRGQLLWIVAGAAALVWVHMANAAWLLSGLGAVGCERSTLRRVIRETEFERSGPSRAADAGGVSYVTGDGMRRFHLATCQLAIGKSLTEIDRRAAVSQSLEPCGMCLS